MPESDLKLICDSIPTSSTGSVSTQANAILKGLTGQDVEFDIQTGGQQPQLYSPTLIQSGLRVVVLPNELNGGFPVTYKYYLEGVEFDGILTTSDDGKSAYVVASSPNFLDAISSSITVYVTARGLYCNKAFQASKQTTDDWWYLWYFGIPGIGSFVTSDSSEENYLEWSKDGGLTWENFNTYKQTYLVLFTRNPEISIPMDGSIRFRVRTSNNYNLFSYITTYNFISVDIFKGVPKDPAQENVLQKLVYPHGASADVFATYYFNNVTNRFSGNNGIYYEDGQGVKHYSNECTPVLVNYTASITQSYYNDSGKKQATLYSSERSIGDEIGITFTF